MIFGYLLRRYGSGFVISSFDQGYSKSTRWRMGRKYGRSCYSPAPATDAFWTFDLDFWADQDVLSCLDTKYCGLCSFEKSWNNEDVV